MSEELPEGWASELLGTLIAELRNGISTRPNLIPPGTPVLRISAVRPGGVSLDECRYIQTKLPHLDTYTLKEKDLLFTRYNGSLDLLGVCGMVRGLRQARLLYPDKLMRVRVDHEIVLPEYLESYFRSPDARRAIMALAKSSAGQQGISGGDLKVQAIPVAPLGEQRRIVTQVEALLEQVNRAKMRLDRVPLILKRFRQAVLAAACSGELTRDWRELRDDPAGASAALSLIDGPPREDVSCLPALPSSWVWASMHQAAQVRGGLQKQPKRSPNSPLIFSRGRIDTAIAHG